MSELETGAKFEDGSYQCLPGPALIAKVLTGRCKMNYTRVAVGQGHIPEGVSPKSLTEPPGYVMDAKIATVTNPVDGECQVTVQIKSDDVETGFYATGIILYAEDPDFGKVPYTYLKLEDGPEWIRPASSAVGKLATFDLIAAVGAVDCVSATIDPDALVTAESVIQLISEHNADPAAHAELFKQLTILDDTGKIPEAYLPDGALKQDGVLIRIITIPVSAWQEDPDGPCAYRAEGSCEGSTEAHIPYVSPDNSSMGTAVSCGLWDKAEAAEGVLRFWAESVPEADIIARAALFGPGGGTSAGSSDGLKLGSGLKKNPDGTISVDVASEAEIQQMLNGVFAPDNK